MASIELTQATRDKIEYARDNGPGANNQNYRAAYDAVYNEIKNAGFDPGTVTRCFECASLGVVNVDG
jgi:hypothetical protein